MAKIVKDSQRVHSLREVHRNPSYKDAISNWLRDGIICLESPNLLLFANQEHFVA
jgi:hypothetical protein